MKKLILLIVSLCLFTTVQAEEVEKNEMYVKTITHYDYIGNVIMTDNIEMTEEEINQDMLISPASQTYCIVEGESVPCIQTEYKKNTMEYKRHNVSTNIYRIYLSLNWLKTPVVTKYDVIALRWSNNVTITKVDGSQTAVKNGSSVLSTYNSTGDNTILGTKGVGITMNMYDDATDHYMSLIVTLTGNPGTVYGTYQHARNANITFDMSQSYTFSASGLGNVLLFSNSTITNYYDGMEGLTDSAPFYDSFA